jgi:predicted DNA-binding transcriptional regulator AlpA
MKGKKEGKDMNNLLNKKQVSEITGISVGELTGKVQREEIPYIRFGHRTVRFDPVEIEDWISAKKVKAVNRPW